MVIGIIDLLLGCLLIIFNVLFKFGWKIREGSLMLGNYVLVHTSKSGDKMWARLEGAAEKKPLISEASYKNIVQISMYLAGILTIGLSAYYLSKKEWLINPYVLLIALLWVSLLGFIPFLHNSLKKRQFERT